jgi:hypothetical protein
MRRVVGVNEEDDLFTGHHRTEGDIVKKGLGARDQETVPITCESGEMPSFESAN